LAFDSLGLIHSVAPNFFAISNLSVFMSIPYMCLAPYILAAYTTERPTAPSPHTATVEPGLIVVLFMAAPHPVLIPHPIKQALVGSEFGFILAAATSQMTVYSLNVEQPMKWKISLPSTDLNLDVPSGMNPLP
jgi:hypothetical protein